MRRRSTESLAKQNYRSELKNIDWDFTGENGTVGFAAYHWYPARYVPQLAGILVNYFTEPGDLVLDPFCGSGTTLLEAFKFGRLAVGVELNPIGVLMTKAKLTPFDDRSFRAYVDTILMEASDEIATLQGSLLASQHAKVSIPNYDENRLWYHKDTLYELASIWAVVHRHSRSRYYDVGRAAFSAILRYCCSQDKHWGWICDNVQPKRLSYKNALLKFSEKLEKYKTCATKLQEDASELQEKVVAISEIKIYQGDCKEILSQFTSQCFDLVVTSPPYFNMTDYMSSQRLSFLWFDYDFAKLRAKEIGARFRRFRDHALDEYLSQLKESLVAIARVLKKGHICCVVVGESPRHEPFLDKLGVICREVGFKLSDRLSRKIPKQRSLSPILHQENIFIFRKI